MGRTPEPTDLDPFDPDSLRIPESDFDLNDVQMIEEQVACSPPKKRYIPPIPETVFNKVCRLPGKSLAVYMVLRQLCKLQRSKTVVLTSSRLAESGITRMPKTDALRHLAEAGFIRVSTSNGKNPTVTLLEV